MKLSYYCASPSCGEINYIKVDSDNRYDLKREIGSDHFNERCKHCGKHTKKHINRLNGEMNMIIVFISVFPALILTIIIWYLGFIIGAITLGIPYLAWSNQKKKVSNFNKLMI
jgi:hypothetical protein